VPMIITAQSTNIHDGLTYIKSTYCRKILFLFPNLIY
jgi:hypothetical protein